MKKKLLAVAVAAAFAVPGVALAQSSVTISGFFKGGLESLSYGQSAKSPKSSHGLVDDSSRIIFNVREDLGGGLAAIAQMDMRFKIDDPQVTGAANVAGQISQGNTHVGFVSKDWGRLFFGRQDLHYFNRESELTVRGSLRADSISILSFAAAGTVAIAGATRTQNVVHYTTPNWSGFTAILAYSSSPIAVDSDIGSGTGAGTIRKGKAWNFNPNFAGQNFQVGYSYWDQKSDPVVVVVAGVPVPTGVNQKAHRLYGSYTWGGLKVGLAWDRSKIRAVAPGADVEASNRTAWSIPVQYRWGNHGVYAHYSKARDDKAAVFAGLQTGAKMWALSYAYDFSKRTSVALTYAKITNDTSAAYNFFTSAALGLGAGTAAIALDEDPKMWGLTIRHTF